MTKKKPIKKKPTKSDRKVRKEISKILGDLEKSSSSEAEWGPEPNDAPNWRKDEDV